MLQSLLTPCFGDDESGWSRQPRREAWKGNLYPLPHPFAVGEEFFEGDDPTIPMMIARLVRDAKSTATDRLDDLETAVTE